MLSKIETNCSAATVTDRNPTAAHIDLLAPPDALSASDEWSECEDDSFFHVAMAFGGPGGRAFRRAASFR